MAVEIVTSIATTILEHSIGAIVRQCGYLWNHKTNISNLKSQVEKLDAVKQDNEHSVLVAEKNDKRIKSQVELWQKNAEEISAEARKVMEEYEKKAKAKCFIWLCPNLVSRYQLSRRAYKKKIEVDEALGEEFKEVGDRQVRRVMSLPSVKDYILFDSRDSTVVKIVNALQDDTKNSIGVYGLGGMGKTTLVKQVASRVAEEGIFDEIVMALVTQTPDLKEIQGQIATKLDLKLEEFSSAERAGRLYGRLKGKKVLVILDDLWEALDLGKVGIPFGSDHMGCKILLTSRFQEVLSSMDAKAVFHLGALEEQEAWSLFVEKTGDVVKNPDFLTIGKDIAKRCFGVPVLIVTVGASLASRPNMRAWKDALNQLKAMKNKKIQEIVYSAVEFISYWHLEEAHKRLFLLCGLLGSRVSINRLLKYSLGWGLFDGSVGRVEGARNRLHTLIRDLKDSCLLLDGDNEDIIHIHDVVRGVAISIASKDLNMFSVGDNDTDLKGLPQDDVLGRCTALVFQPSHNLLSLPESLKCPLLELLILNVFSRDFSLAIPDTFFERTIKLKVLDMSRMSFQTLPPSLSFLGNLHTLRLDGCNKLKDVSILGELKKLQVLSFVNSEIEELPGEIGQFSELRFLDLTGCRELKVIPAGLLEGLSQLEELYMRQSFKRWEAKGCHTSSKTSNVSLAELKHLSNLRILEIEVPDVKLVSKDVDFESLERYRIIVGNENVNFGNWEFHRLKFDKKEISKKISVLLDTTSINHLPSNIVKLLKRAESLCLQELKGIESVDELDGDGFTDLKHLSIETDYEIKFIINVEFKQQAVFPALESLYLNKLLKLEKICNGRLMQGSLCKLTTVNVKNCDKLESLFSFSMAMGLPCLEELEVSDCSILKGIVAEKSKEEDNVDTDDTVSEMIVFPQLRKLSLKGLPELKSFKCSAKMLPILKERQIEEISPEEEEEEPDSSMPFFKEVEELGSNEIIHTVKQPLFNEKAIFPSLKELKIKNLDNIESIWHNRPNEEDSFCKLDDVYVCSCAKLLKIFPSTMVSKIQNVEKVRISCCGALEEIFEVQTGLNLNEITHDVTTVLQLRSLTLMFLPKLRFVWGNAFRKILSFENLVEVKVHDCGSMRHVFPTFVAQCLHQLEKLHIEDCEGVETIFDGDGEENKEVLSLENLRDVYVKRCGSMRHVFKTFVAQCLHQLEKLHIEDCEGVETIVDDDGEENKEVVEEIKEEEKEVSTAFIFPKLTQLCLKKLPKVECFYPRKHTLEWPLLRQLDVTGSDQISILDLLNFSESEDRNQFEKLLSYFERFGIRSKDMKMLTRQYGHFPSELFLNLKELTLTEFDGDESINFSSKFLHGLQVLETLVVKKCSFQEIFSYDGEGEGSPAVLPPHLGALTLDMLPELKYICKDDSVCFKYLMKLTVTNCVGLINLIQPSAAASLGQLRELRINNCEMIEEIVVGDGDHDSQYEIIFGKLCRLELKYLRELTSFCRANYTFKFPELSEVTVVWCPNMTTFSQGITITPKLHKVDFEWGKGKRWNGDLNTTVQHPFFETLLASCFLKIRSKDMKMLMRHYGHFPSDLFVNLECLKIMELNDDECPDFPSNFFRGLNTLESLEVRDCRFHEIFPSDGEGPPVLLPHLESLELVNLPELKYICKEDLPLIPILEKLEYLSVVQCPRLTNIVPGSVSFKFLEGLTVQDCGGLINLLPSSVAASLEQLVWLGISGCQMMEEIVAADGDHDSEEDKIIIFSKLEELELGELPRLTSFCTANYTFDFPILEKVTVRQCPSMKTFSPKFAITPKLQKVDWTRKFHSEDSEERWNGDLNATVQHLFLETEAHQRLTAGDPSTSSSNHHSEPEAQIHDNPTVIEEICEESSKQREEGQTSEPAKTENNIEPTEEVNICGDATRLAKGKEKIDPDYQVQASCSYTNTIPFRGESSVSTEQQTNAGSLAPRDVVASSSLLSPESNHPETSPSLVAEARTSRAGSNSQQNDLQISQLAQEFITLETKRLDTTDPSTSSNNRSEPEAKQIESAGKEVEEFSYESIEPRDEGQTCERGIDENDNTIEPSDGKKIEEISEDLTEPGNKVEMCEDFIKPEKEFVISEKVIEPRDGIEIPDKCSEPNSLSLESNILKKSHPYSQTHVSTSFRSTIPLYEDGESSLPEEESSAGYLAPQDVVASSSLLSPTSNCPETSLTLATKPRNSRRASSSDSHQILRATMEYITLLSKFLHIRQTQPLNTMSTEDPICG